ncbi:MAG: hypothetical protein ACHQ01_02460 [Candidatus Limnocylindrales bacterium]
MPPQTASAPGLERTVQHSTFVIERDFDATPSRVFAAFVDPVAKARWFAGPADWVKSWSLFDFRIGGHEHTGSGPAGGPVHYFDAVYRTSSPTGGSSTGTRCTATRR